MGPWATGGDGMQRSEVPAAAGVAKGRLKAAEKRRFGRGAARDQKMDAAQGLWAGLRAATAILGTCTTLTALAALVCLGRPKLFPPG